MKQIKAAIDGMRQAVKFTTKVAWIFTKSGNLDDHQEPIPVTPTETPPLLDRQGLVNLL